MSPIHAQGPSCFHFVYEKWTVRAVKGRNIVAVQFNTLSQGALKESKNNINHSINTLCQPAVNWCEGCSHQLSVTMASRKV